MWNPTTSTLKVARHELADSIRSRRAAVLLVIYFVGSLAATAMFVKVLHQVENQVEAAVGIAKSRQAGGATAALWQNPHLREFLTHMSGDEQLARQLLSIPPLALFYGWLSMTFAPLLVMLMSSARISEEIWSGSVRFVLFRTSRLSWCFGKFLGQGAQLLVALLLSAVAAGLIGSLKLAAFDPLTNFTALGVQSLKAWVYAMAFLGLATGISQLVAGPNLASALGFAALIGMSVVSALSSHLAGSGWRRAWDFVNLLTPAGHRPDLWRLDGAHLLPAVVFLLLLGVLYLLAGFAAFARRDL